MATLSGGDKLAKILADIGGKAQGSVDVGFMSGATYPDGTPVAQVAFWNEFGHGGRFPAPPRPFFRNMVNEKSSEWPKRLGDAIKYYEGDGRKALAGMGEAISDDLAESIINTNEPALSKTTLMLRSIYGNNPQEIRARDVLAAQELVEDGFQGAGGSQAKPLVWTGHMLNSITYEVKE